MERLWTVGPMRVGRLNHWTCGRTASLHNHLVRPQDTTLSASLAPSLLPFPRPLPQRTLPPIITGLRLIPPPLCVENAPAHVCNVNPYTHGNTTAKTPTNLIHHTSWHVKAHPMGAALQLALPAASRIASSPDMNGDCALKICGGSIDYRRTRT